MSLSVILCLTALALLLATAASGIAIAILERRGVVPRIAEGLFVGLAGAGSAVLVASVVSMHPLTADPVLATYRPPSVTGSAFAAVPSGAGHGGEAIAASWDGAEVIACVPPAGSAAYDRFSARLEGDAGKGDGHHEVSVFRSSVTR